MACVLVTGAATGLGRNTVAALLDDGHEAVLHARHPGRLTDVRDLLDRGAVPVTGDLATHEGTLSVVEQANTLGGIDAVIHNAGVYDGPDTLAVNVLAPYLLTCLVTGPDRHVYLSSSMHNAGHADAGLIDSRGPGLPLGYSDSKLFVTALAAAVPRRLPAVHSFAVDPGWVPTRMGGPSAPDDLTLGHVTQFHLATASDPDATGGYWHHQHRQTPHRAVRDEGFQDEVLDALAHRTGITLTPR
ncbi:SDR family NAD(P)-dependent oxidoreductase [Streptomyces sp. SID9124]|uniref:SDR family NAD(P)-dependent oxidoreductase n=1 Tax=Streptomyces sp. SID9124 TaxID=2706108 RepID=UPI0013E07011|nr:SDR family NAD(P)-dependent oxidoreductase [Streptomyces sp. SID9124]NED16438.1 SDR family NAD(P)-dependent oxidoreductase [Streptomyces sp. SID9124]